jgi:hypothetical protein
MISAVAGTISRRTSGRPVTSRFWLLATPLTALLLGIIPLLADRRYYFHGDTQTAYAGWWYELGNQVLNGHWPLMSTQAWESGNYIAEGQWGLFSPLTILIGLAVRLSPNVVAVVILIKLALIMIGALGMYLLLRSFRVTAAAAYVGGVLVGLGGQSVQYDWPAWVNGHMATVLLPWAWWLTRRAMRGHNPFPALLACYLIVTIGYVYAPLYLAIVIVSCLVDAGVARDRAALLRALGIGAFSALVFLTVYLPGVLTAPVTVRSNFDIESGATYTVTVGNIFTSMLPTTGRLYLLWCLPLVLWIDLAKARIVMRELRGVTVATAVVLAWVLGPTKVGPLRWPGRVEPALVVMLVVLLVVVVSRSIVIPGRARILASLAWLLAAAWVVISQDWGYRNTTLAGAAVVGAAIIVVAWSLRRSTAVAALAIGLCTLAVFVTQQAVTSPGGADRHSPARADAAKTQIPAARGDVLVIGSYSTQSETQPALAKELLVGSEWYRNPAVVQNGYSTIRFRTFIDKFCRQYNGLTCKGMLTAVLADDPTTGKPWVDLLSISTLVMYRPDFTDSRLHRPPPGWAVAATSRSTVTWVRDTPVPAAGGVVSTSAGVSVAEQHEGNQSVRLRVNSVPSGGGTVVFSRLAWPGYTVSGASLAKPTAQFLVTVHLDPSSVGRTVTLSWSPPGWRTEVTAWWLAIVGGLAWSLALVVRSVRRRRSASSGRSGDPGEDDAPVEPPSGGSREDEADDVRRQVVGQRRVEAENVARDGEAPGRYGEGDGVHE